MREQWEHREQTSRGRRNDRAGLFPLAFAEMGTLGTGRGRKTARQCGPLTPPAERGGLLMDRPNWPARSPSFEASEAITGITGQAPQQVLAKLADIAAEIAKGLRRGEAVCSTGYDPDLDGPATTPAEDAYFAIEARYFLETLAAFMAPDGGHFHDDELAFNVRLTKRPGWKPRETVSEGKRRRLDAAARVYDLMAADAVKGIDQPKQWLALEQVMQETGLPRSKVMQGIKELRQGRADFLLDWFGREYGLSEVTLAQAHADLALGAMRRLSPPETEE